MIIGGITLPDEYTPLEVTKPRPQRTVSVIETYSGVAVFDWGSILPGKIITLKWRSMKTDLFDTLDAVYQNGGTVVWDTGMDGKGYNVEIINFDGSLLYDNNGNENMLDITMVMVIISEVTI